MRKLMVLIVLLTAVWSGYWFVGSNAIRQGAEDFFANAAAQGLVAEKTALTVQGFPNRFDLTVDGLRLVDSDTGTTWEAPFLQVFAMTWKPWHIIAVLPPTQQVMLPDQAITLTSDAMRASVRAKPATDLPLATVIVESGPFSATSTAGWTVGAAKAVASISADEVVPNAGDAPNAYVLALDLTDLAPDPKAIEKIVTDAGLPPTVAVIKVLATATLTAPLDRFAGDAHPRLTALDLTDSLITWGDLSVAAKGTISPDDEGYASGRIEIAVTNYQRLVPALVAAGAIKPEISQTVGNMLDAMAKESGDPNLLQLPLILQDGRVSLGPLPLGDAPLLLPPSG
jgi:hypothetical protein